MKRFIGWAGENFDLPILQEFLHATPTAELEPITATYVQSDEADMGVTYAELGVFGVRIPSLYTKSITLANPLLVPTKGFQVGPLVDVREATAFVGQRLQSS